MDNEELNKKLDEIWVKLDSKADKADLDARFDKMDERFERNEDTMTALFEAVRDGFADMNRRFELRFLEQDLKMEAWRSECRVFVEGLQSNRGRITSLEDRVESLESRATG